MKDLTPLYNLIRELRRREGDPPLREVAARSGGRISYAYLGVLERGLDTRTKKPPFPTPEKLKAVADIYNYPYEELLRLAGYLETEESNLAPKNADADFEVLYRDFKELTPHDREVIMDLVRARRERLRKEGKIPDNNKPNDKIKG